MGSASTKSITKDYQSSSQADSLISSQLELKDPCNEDRELRKLKRKSDESERPYGDEVDMDDPLLITKVKARANRVRNPKKIQRTSTTKENKRHKVEKELNVVNPEAKARRYQLEGFKKALQENSILYLETGGGKTLVAVLLIKALARNLRLKDDKRIAVFLVPKVILVHQQAEVIAIHTDLKVEEYWGEKGVDTWSIKEWQTQISENEVLVMTPQIFLNNLQHGFFKMEMVELLIFDECHHAKKNHAYARIMLDFYHKDPRPNRVPKIFGMTASPLTKRGVKTSSEAANQLTDLEVMLDSKVFTFKDREEVEKAAPTPSSREEYYIAPNIDTVASPKGKLEDLLQKFEEANMRALGDKKLEYKDQEELIEKLEKRTAKLHRDLQYCLEELGVWCAYKAAEHWMKGDGVDNDLEAFVDIAHTLRHNKEAFLKAAIQTLQPAVPKGWAESCRQVQELEDAVSRGYLTPKVQQLVTVLSEKRSGYDERCIVFVERIVAAVVLASLVNRIGCLSEFLSADWMSGSKAGLESIQKRNQKIMEAFQDGKVNILVATEVAEEGLDVKSCSSVIRFDLPKTVRSHIQSRGRARRPGSEFIIFLERGNEQQKDLVSTVKVSEESMREQAVSRSLMQPNANLPEQAIVDSYCVDRTGATVDTNNSVAWLSQFCSKLPGDKYYTPKPEYSVEEDGSSFICTVKLPPNAPIYQLVGSSRVSSKLAKQMAALEALKQLHVIGALNDHLVPILDEDDEESMNLKNSSGAGTNKRKELHPSMVPLALKGQWQTGTAGTCLHGYVLNFEVQPSEEKTYASFVLLIGTEFDDDVAHLKTRLCLPRDREAIAELSPVGKLILSSNQLKEAMLFQELLFNGLFNRLTKYIKVAKKLNRETCGPSLTINSDNWSPNNMYLILPAASNTTKNTSNHAPIDWDCIRRTVRAIESVGQAENSENGSSRINSALSIFSSFGQSAVRAQEKGTLHMARGSQMLVSQVVDAAVMTIHTGKIYAVVKVFGDKTAGSPFPEKKSGEKSRFSNYAEFFKIKHGQILDYPDQPLLNLKQTHRIHNLLPVSRVIKEKARSSVEAVPVGMPPELCLVLGISTAVVRSAYLIPSVMHRLKSALTASHLRHTIQKAIPSTPAIPITRVLEAITTLRCNESFNMERLELLGDSFLKYAVSRKLFLFYEEKHEGQLSGRRMHQICNARLHELALDRNLPVYIRDELFDPSRWVAPGMYSSKEVKCKCKFEQIGQPFKGTISKAVIMSRNEVYTEEPGDASRTNVAKPLQVVPKLGRSCDSGHRYLCSKTIADVMEALIGAYLIEGSYAGALSFMAWAGFDVDCGSTLIKSSSERSLFDTTQNFGIDINSLEQRIGYTFCNKSLLLEAMTHASNMLNNLDGKAVCYQRLEFLGDAVLDCFISQHLFSAHRGLTPGHLTTLRSAAVNNERFARVAVKHKLHCYLRHGSGLLMSQIHNFVKALEAASDEQKNSSFGLDGLQGPKVLGDLVESIAGAILVDTSFNLDAVWVVMKPLLSPIITPETLMQHPVVELHELCSRNGYSHTLKTISYGQEVIAQYEVKVGEEEAIIRRSRRPHKKTAQKDAAQKVLEELETRGHRESTKGRSKRSEPAPVVATESEASASKKCSVGDLHTNEDKLGVSITDTESDITTSLESESDAGVLVNVEASSNSNQLGEIKQSHTDSLEVDHKTNYLDQVTSKNLIEVDSQVQQPVIEQGHMKKLVEVDPLPSSFQSPVDATCVSPQTPDERVEQSHTSTMKRKLEPNEEDSKAAEKRAKYFWSQEKSVNELSTNVTIVTEKIVSSSFEEPMDISTFCPWTGRNSSVDTVTEVQVKGTTRSSSVLCAVNTSTEVPAEGRRIQCSSTVINETSKKVQEVIVLPLQPMTTMTVAHQSAVICTGDTTPKKPTKDVPVNCRQALNTICTKYKWILDFNLKSEEGMPHVRRFIFSVTVDTKVDTFMCDGEKKTTKKQAQESAASAMMSLIQHKGLIHT